MNADELNAYLAEYQLQDSWWVLQNEAWLESVMTLAQIELLNGAVQVLHETQANVDPPPMVDFQKKVGLPSIAKNAAAPQAGAAQAGAGQDRMTAEQREFIVNNRLCPAMELKNLTKLQAGGLIEQYNSNKRKKLIIQRSIQAAGVLAFCGAIVYGVIYYRAEAQKEADDAAEAIRVAEQDELADEQAKYDLFNGKYEEYKTRRDQEWSKHITLHAAIDQGAFDRVLKEAIKRREEAKPKVKLIPEYNGVLTWDSLKRYSGSNPQIYVLLSASTDKRNLDRILRTQAEAFEELHNTEGQEDILKKWEELKANAPKAGLGDTGALREFADKVNSRMRVAKLQTLADTISLLEKDITSTDENISAPGQKTARWANSQLANYIKRLVTLNNEYQDLLPENKKAKWDEIYSGNLEKINELIDSLLEEKITMDEDDGFKIKGDSRMVLLAAAQIKDYWYYSPVTVSINGSRATGRSDMASVELTEIKVEVVKEEVELDMVEERKSLVFLVDKVVVKNGVSYLSKFRIGEETKEVVCEVPIVYTLYCKMEGSPAKFYLITTKPVNSDLAGQTLPGDMYGEKYTRDRFFFPAPTKIRWGKSETIEVGKEPEKPEDAEKSEDGEKSEPVISNQ